MKKLIFINGTMGVGKTTTATHLKRQLLPSVYLDGDWCWDMFPFQVTEKSKAMVLKNICFLLRSFLKSDLFEYVIFSWVIPDEKIFKTICDSLDNLSFEQYRFTLLCSDTALRTRLLKEVMNGQRTQDVIERSLSYQSLYPEMKTYHIDVSEITAEKAAEKIIHHVQNDKPF